MCSQELFDVQHYKRKRLAIITLQLSNIVYTAAYRDIMSLLFCSLLFLSLPFSFFFPFCSTFHHLSSSLWLPLPLSSCLSLDLFHVLLIPSLRLNIKKTNTDPIFIIQRRAIEIVNKISNREPTNQLFSKLKALKFKDPVDFKTA